MKFTLKNIGVMAVGVIAGLIGLQYLKKLVPGFSDLAEGESSWWPF